MGRLLILALGLAAAWLVWSGLFKPLIFGLGALSLGLVLWLAIRMKVTEHGAFSLDLVPRLLGFWAWLLKEIVKSNLTVARIVLSPRLDISPRMVTLHPPTKGLQGQAILANSITLTPGTVTVDAHDGTFKVHCLTQQGAADLETGEMARRIHKAVGDR